MIKLSAPNIMPNDADLVRDALMYGQIDPGPAAEEFACALAEFWGVPRRYVLLTNSCTTAIALASWLLGKKANTRIGTEMRPVSWIAPALTWPGTYCGVRDHYLVDVRKDLHIDTNSWMGSLRSVGVIDVNLFGDHDGLTTSPGDIIDSAHCVHPSGMLGLVEEGKAICFSFGPTKEITTLRGGALVHRRAHELEQRIRCNTVDRVPQEGWGVNGTITEIGARLGLNQLRRYSDSNARRWKVLEEYKSKVWGYDHVELVTRPGQFSGHLAVVRFADAAQRDKARILFSQSGIPTSIHYPVRKSQAYPVACDLSSRLLSLPCHAGLNVKDIRLLGQVADRVFYATRPGTAGVSGKA